MCIPAYTLFLPCGSRLACDYEGVRPDVIVLGKALSGGTMPVSAHIHVAVPADLLCTTSSELSVYVVPSYIPRRTSLQASYLYEKLESNNQHAVDF